MIEKLDNSRIKAGMEVSIRKPLKNRSFTLLPKEDGLLTISALCSHAPDTRTLSPVRLAVCTAKDEDLVSSWKMVVPEAAKMTGEGTELLLRSTFSPIVDALATENYATATLWIGEYNRIADSIATSTGELFGYPRQLVWNPYGNI